MNKQRNRRVRKSIAIIGEGLTEYRYVDDMRTTERYRFSLVPGIPKHSDVDDIVNLANERVKAGYDYVLCLKRGEFIIKRIYGFERFDSRMYGIRL